MGQNLLAWTEHGRVNLHAALTYQSGAGGDTTPPTISNVQAANPNNGPRFNVTWVTDEPSTSVVTFTCCGSLNDDTLIIDHSLGMRGDKGATYEYWVSSSDTAGNPAAEGPFYFTN